MPYLNKKITIHNKGCKNPNVKRLYIRDYDNKGKQKYVPYAVTCTNCGALVKEIIVFNPTAKQITKLKTLKKLDKKIKQTNLRK